MNEENIVRLSAEAPLTFERAGMSLAVVEETGSTNDDCKSFIKEGVIQQCPFLLIAQRQRAGRGTRGHKWRSVVDALTFSMAFQGVKLAGGLTIGIGMAVAALVREQLGIELSVKWPNDLWLQDAKVGGILSEVVSAADGRQGLVVGVGLNVVAPYEQLDKWAMRGLYLDRGEVLGIDWDHLLLGLAEQIRMVVQSPAPIDVTCWRRYDALLGASLKVEMPDGQHLFGENAGISPDGALLIKTEAGTVAVTNGSIIEKKNAR